MLHLLESSRLQGGEVPCLFIYGEPGVGKTTFAQMYVSYLQAKGLPVVYNYFQCNASTTEKDMIYKINIPNFVGAMTGGSKDSIILKSSVINSMIASKDAIQVLLIDELDKADPEVDSYLLQTLEEGICSDALISSLNNGHIVTAVKSNFIPIITTNSQRKLNSALNRRGDHVIMMFPNKKEMLSRISKMLTREGISVSIDAIKYGVDFMYKYREQSPKFTMAPNQLVRILASIAYAESYSVFKDMLTARISPYEQDIKLVQEKIHDLNYISKMLWTK